MSAKPHGVTTDPKPPVPSEKTESRLTLAVDCRKMSTKAGQSAVSPRPVCLQNRSLANFRRALAQDAGNSAAGLWRRVGSYGAAAGFEVLLHFGPIKSDQTADLAVWQESFAHPSVDGPRSHPQPTGHLILIDVYICAIITIHLSTGRGAARDRALPASKNRSCLLLVCAGEHNKKGCPNRAALAGASRRSFTPR